MSSFLESLEKSRVKFYDTYKQLPKESLELCFLFFFKGAFADLKNKNSPTATSRVDTLNKMVLEEIANQNNLKVLKGLDE